MSLIEVVRYGGWTELILDRSDRRNALSGAMADEFVAAFEDVSASSAAVVISARGSVFCAGADLKEGMSLDADRPSSRILRTLISPDTFVISAVEGGVYGAGISLLAASAVVVADSRAVLALPESSHGIFPVGVVPYLERSVPRRRLLSLGMTAGVIPAREAFSYGLFTDLVDDGAVPARARWWAEQAVELPEVALQAQKWWASPFNTKAHRDRIDYLEGLLGSGVSRQASPRQVSPRQASGDPYETT